MLTIRGWWFTQGDRLKHGDGRLVKLGTTHTVTGKIVPYKHGLHLASNPLDALSYDTGTTVYRVLGSGKIIPHGLKHNEYACSRRTYLSGGIDVSDLLLRFARLCALDIIKRYDVPPELMRYLRTGNPELMSTAQIAAKTLYWTGIKANCLIFGLCSKLRVTAALFPWAAAKAALSTTTRGSEYKQIRNRETEKHNRRLHRMLMEEIRKRR